MTQDGTLVLSCWYTRFQKAVSGVLRYEEDLSGEAGGGANTLRAHLADALAKKSEIQLVVAMAPSTAPVSEADGKKVERPKQTTFHARKDLLGQLTYFDGQRFVIEFRKRADA